MLGLCPPHITHLHPLVPLVMLFCSLRHNVLHLRVCGGHSACNLLCLLACHNSAPGTSQKKPRLSPSSCCREKFMQRAVKTTSREDFQMCGIPNHLLLRFCFYFPNKEIPSLMGREKSHITKWGIVLICFFLKMKRLTSVTFCK